MANETPTFFENMGNKRVLSCSHKRQLFFVPVVVGVLAITGCGSYTETIRMLRTDDSGNQYAECKVRRVYTDDSGNRHSRQKVWKVSVKESCVWNGNEAELAYADEKGQTLNSGGTTWLQESSVLADGMNAAAALKILYGNVELPQPGQRTPLTMLVEKNAGVAAELSRWRGTPLNMVAQQTVWHPKAVSSAYAVWHNVKPPKDWGAGEIDSQAVFAVHEWRYSEKGKEKYFLLTQTTDLKEPQACFACLPIIGAAVFSKEGGKWVLEAENKYVGMTGGYGVLGGDVGLAEVGPEKHGIVHNLVITKYNCRGGVFDIIMPYHGSIGSFRVGEYEELCIRDNGVAVGRIDALPSGFGFDRSASAGGYYEVTRKLRSQTNARSKVVTTTQRFRFTNGAYKSVKAVSRKKK